jgi:hypothetical protein
MKISELIKILQAAPDKNRDVYTESVGNYYTTNLHFDFDDNNDMCLYEVAAEFLADIERRKNAIAKLSQTEILI